MVVTELFCRRWLRCDLAAPWAAGCSLGLVHYPPWGFVGNILYYHFLFYYIYTSSLLSKRASERAPARLARVWVEPAEPTLEEMFPGTTAAPTGKSLVLPGTPSMAELAAKAKEKRALRKSERRSQRDARSKEEAGVGGPGPAKGLGDEG